MKKFLSILLAIALVAMMCVGVVACDNENTPDKGNEDGDDTFTLGVITLHDTSSTYDKNFIDAANDVAKELGIKVIIKSNVKESIECYEAAIDLVDQGCDAIFADSFGHEEFLLQAAKENPNVQFAHATGTMAHTEKLANFHNAFAAIYEGRYLAGIVAGMKLNEMIAQGKEPVIGYVGAYPYAEVKSGYTSFFLGVRSVCPTATMKVAFTNSWYSANREKEAANALIKQGCVLMSQHADSYGAPGACNEAGVPDVTYNLSTIDEYPETYLAGSKINWRTYFKHLVEATKNKDASFATEYDWTGTIADGSVEFIAFNADIAATGTATAIEEAKEAFAKGFKVYNVENFTVTVVNTGDWSTSKNLNATVDENGKLTAYQADVDSDPNYAADTQVLKTEGDVTYFAESYFRSAPYFNIDIDGITIIGTFDKLAE